MKEIPALYDVARKITLELGLPYTDPRNGKTYQPRGKSLAQPKRRKKKHKKHQ
jgi:hypothetical protein